MFCWIRSCTRAPQRSPNPTPYPFFFSPRQLSYHRPPTAVGGLTVPSIPHRIIHARRRYAFQAVELADRGQEVSGRADVGHDDERDDVAIGAVEGFVLDHRGDADVVLGE